MEEEKQLPFPIKTKIAAWWMIVVGGGGLVYSIAITIREEFIPFLLPFSLFIFFLPGLFLLKKKKWAWLYAIIIFLIGAVLFASAFVYNLLIEYEIKDIRAAGNFLLAFLPPFILLLLDRKNFWRIAS